MSLPAFSTSSKICKFLAQGLLCNCSTFIFSLLVSKISSVLDMKSLKQWNIETFSTLQCNNEASGLTWYPAFIELIYLLLSWYEGCCVDVVFCLNLCKNLVGHQWYLLFHQYFWIMTPKWWGQIATEKIFRLPKIFDAQHGGHQQTATISAKHLDYLQAVCNCRWWHHLALFLFIHNVGIP